MIWTDDGLNEARVVLLQQVVLGDVSEEQAGPFDDEDREYMEGLKKELADAKAKGITLIPSIPQM